MHPALLCFYYCRVKTRPRTIEIEKLARKALDVARDFQRTFSTDTRIVEILSGGYNIQKNSIFVGTGKEADVIYALHHYAMPYRKMIKKENLIESYMANATMIRH